MTRGYDNADRFSTLTDWNNKVTTFGYDNDSNLASTAFPNGVIDTTTRNTADQITGINVANGASTLASFGYTPDLAGQLKTGTDSLAPAALSTTFGYSKLNQLGTVASATASYTYDNSGNLTGLTNGSTLTYDNAGQLKVLTPTTGQPTTFAYNNVGDRTSATTPGTGTVPGTIGSDVNVSADITTGAGTITTAAFTTSTANEQFLALVAAGPGTGTQSVTVTVTGAGLTWTRVNQANTQAGDAEIWTAAATSKLTGQTVTAVQASAAGKLSLQVLSFTGSAGIGASTNGSAATGAARVTLTTTGANSRTFAVGFDGPANAATTVAPEQTLLHALTVTGSPGNGWMQKKTGATANAGTVVPLADASPTTLAWNMAAVEVLAAPVPAPASTVTYGYDQTSRLSSYAKTGSPTTIYKYNGDGLRAVATTSSLTTAYAWDTIDGLPLLLSDKTNDYIYGPTGQVVEQVNKTTGVTTYLHTDRIGSIRVATDATGAVTRTASYDPYGNVITQTGTAATPFGFSGEYTDLTGLVYLRHRYYDTATGSFLTTDPLVDSTRAPYAYAAGNPLNVSDPLGLSGGSDFGVGLAHGYLASLRCTLLPAVCAAQAVVRSGQQIADGAGVLETVITNLDPAYQAINNGALALDALHRHCYQQAGEATYGALQGGANTLAFAIGITGSAAGLANRLTTGESLTVGAADTGGSLSDLFANGAPKASDLGKYAEGQGWKASQTATGPLKYTDENGVVRVTIKRGSARTPGSEDPHVELRGADGQRIDPSGNPVTRNSPGNHTPIDWDGP